MKLKKMIFVVGISLLSLCSYAASTKNSNISLVGGTISPRQTLQIATDKLVPGGSYTVMCTISDSNNKANPVTVKVNVAYPAGWGGGQITLNGNYINGSQFSLTQVDNQLQLTRIQSVTPISITNLDQSDSVKVSDCVAIAETGN